MKRVLLRILLAIFVVTGIGLLIPQNLKMPVVGADGNSYEVFYVAKSSGDLTTIEIPKGYAYTVSGDNVGGFIVTVNLSQPTA